jgi:hypothetical protein
MNCQTSHYFFDDYLSGNLSDEDKNGLETHLKNCPDCRASLKLEEAWLKTIAEDGVSDPGEGYWNKLEDQILKRTTGAADNEKIIDISENPIRRMFKYLIPVAASIAVFLGITQNEMKPDVIPQTAEITSPEQEKNDHKLCSDIKLKPEIIKTILLAPPGSASSHIAIGRLKQNKQG